MLQVEAVGTGRGRYDLLYRGTDLLWSDSPGRMVAEVNCLTSPGRALDLGCGDGRNLVWLEGRGWNVDGVDVSSAALSAARRRIHFRGVGNPDRLLRRDACEMDIPENTYDLVLAYGLYHCIDDNRLARLHSFVTSALRPGGFFVFSCLDSRLPVPPDHMTGPLFLRSTAVIWQLFSDLTPVRASEGEIDEHHGSLVGPHRHSAVWGIFRR
jgi:SAM-dependent methyltransferase